ncbi:biotin transporter BioY [Acidaminobacter sp. JC074]|uniref:biotin transporter BioY n=1 Tax=Acidaminobacter sp. JC074 TaxID=2530199 RepID=UPI001F0F60F4|nr:biotin transporter BioY [Acidaminobacter sp. JC074]
MNTKLLLRTSLAVALIALGAQIKLPSPIAGYFTLQLPAVIIISCVLGKKYGPLSVGIYILGGLLGIPWFAGGGGLAYVLKPTFGFLLGFIALSYLTGMGQEKKHTWLYALLGTFLVWLIGMLYLTSINVYYLGVDMSYMSGIMAIFSLDLVFDFVLTLTAVTIGKRVESALELI